MITLILTKPEKVKNTFITSVKKNGKNVLGILSTRTYSTLNKELTKACDKKACFFIDTISDTESEENVVYISSSNLTALSIAINQAQQPFDGKATVIFDSISNFAIRNSQEVLIKFFLFIIKECRSWGANLILIAPEDGTNTQLISLLKQYADKVEKK